MQMIQHIESSQSTNAGSKANFNVEIVSSSSNSSFSLSKKFTGETGKVAKQRRSWTKFVTGERTCFATFLRLVALAPLPLFALLLTQVSQDTRRGYAIDTIKYPIVASAIGIVYFSRSFSYVTKKQNPGNGLCLNCLCSPCFDNAFEILEIIVITVGTCVVNILSSDSIPVISFPGMVLPVFITFFMSLPINLLIKQIRLAQKASITGYFASLASKFFVSACLNMVLIFYSGIILSRSQHIHRNMIKNTSSYNYTSVIHSAVYPAMDFDVLVISGLLSLWVFLDAMFVGRGMIRKNQKGGIDQKTLALFAKKHMILALFLIAVWTITACFCVADLLINGIFLSLPPPMPIPDHPLEDLPSVCYNSTGTEEYFGPFSFRTSCTYLMKYMYAVCGCTFIVIIGFEVVPWKNCCCNNKASHDLLQSRSQVAEHLLDMEQREILKDVILQKRKASQIQPVDSRYVADNMIIGDRIKAAGNLIHHMGITDGDDFVTTVMKVPGTGYVEAIRTEVMNHPALNDPLPEWEQPLNVQQDSTLPKMTLKTWFNYILNEPASEMEFSNGIRDKGRSGWRLDDFLNEINATGLKKAHVLALRLYTTKIFRFINNPLREEIQHPMPATVLFLQEGLKLLRKNAASELKGSTSLWRGFKNLNVQTEFLDKGGTELAPMSTSTKLDIAAQYSTNGAPGERALIMKLKIEKNNYLSYGADVTWLSAFPGENERLFPPLTFLRPSERPTQTVTLEGITFTIVEVVPQLN